MALVSSIGCNRSPIAPVAGATAAPAQYPQNANPPQNSAFAPAPTNASGGQFASTDRRYSGGERHPVERLDRDAYDSQPIQNQTDTGYTDRETAVRDSNGRERVVREYSAPVRREYVTNRKFSHSAAIVGGSAAAGAAIGALAGGGKGAAIGALAGGGGGFVYDRLTHKKVRVE